MSRMVERGIRFGQGSLLATRSAENRVCMQEVMGVMTRSLLVKSSGRDSLGAKPLNNTATTPKTTTTRQNE